MSRKQNLLREDLASLLKKFSSSDVVSKLAKEYAAETSLLLPIEQIVDNRYLNHIDIDEGELAKMVTSIQANREVAPLIVRPYEGKHEIVLGRRRYYAAKRLGMKEVPVISKPFTDVEMLLTIFVNLRQSRENDVMSLATLGQALKTEFGYSQQALAQVGQMSRPAIANVLRLLKLPLSVQKMIALGELSYGHARAILPVPQGAQLEYVNAIKKNHWSVRQLEHLVGTQYPKANKQGKGINPGYDVSDKDLCIHFSNKKALREFLKRLQSLKLL